MRAMDMKYHSQGPLLPSVAGSRCSVQLIYNLVLVKQIPQGHTHVLAVIASLHSMHT